MQGSLTYPHSLCACSVMGLGDSCVWVWMVCGEGQKVSPSMPKLTLLGEESVSLMHSLMFLGFFGSACLSGTIFVTKNITTEELCDI